MSEGARLALLQAIELLDKAGKRRIVMDGGAHTVAARIRQDVRDAVALLHSAEGWARTQ